MTNRFDELFDSARDTAEKFIATIESLVDPNASRSRQTELELLKEDYNLLADHVERLETALKLMLDGQTQVALNADASHLLGIKNTTILLDIYGDEIIVRNIRT